MNYEEKARTYGFTDFEDSEDPTLLVVASDDYDVHFDGPSAWEDAVSWIEETNK